MNGQRREVVVAGTVISAECIYLTSPGSLIDEQQNYGLFYVKQAFAEVLDGLEAGHTVVDAPESGIADGTRVKVAE